MFTTRTKTTSSFSITDSGFSCHRPASFPDDRGDFTVSQSACGAATGDDRSSTPIQSVCCGNSALLLLALAFAIHLSAGYAPQVSFSVEHSPSAVKTSLRLPAAIGLSWLGALAGLLGGWVVYQFSAQAIWMIGCALLIFCLLLPVVSKRLLRNSSGVFEATRTKASPVLLSYGAALAAALS